jgi:hypothetical protein
VAGLVGVDALTILAVLGTVIYLTVRHRIVSAAAIEDEELADEAADTAAAHKTP